MPFPTDVTTRPVSVGGAMVLESSGLLALRVLIRASRSLVRESTGFRFEKLGVTTQGQPGGEVIINLPVTDQAGWKDPALNAIIDVSVPNSYTHQYTAEVYFTDADGNSVGIAPIELGPFVVPSGDSVIDLDKNVPASTIAGGAVSIPDIWSQKIAEAEAVAAELQAIIPTTSAAVAESITTDGPAKTVLTSTFVAKPAGIAAGQVAIWDGTAWVAGDAGSSGLNWVFAGTSSSSTTQGYGLAVGAAANNLVGVTPTIERIGVAGQTSNQALSALRTRIATGKLAAVVFVQMTPNDGRVNGQGIPQATTAANYRKMVALVRAAGSVPVLTTATPIDIAQYNSANYNAETVATQAANNQMLRNLAAELGEMLVDLFATFQYRSGFLADGLHLNASGDAIAGAVVASKVLGFPDPYPPEVPWQTIIADNFDRANGALGSTSTGNVAWAETSATAPYIESNRMRANNNGQFASVATGVATFEASATIIAGSQTRSGVIIAVDANNYLYWGTPSNTSARLYKTIAGGTATQIGQANTIAWADGQSHTLAARVQGNTIRLYIDGVLVETYTLSTDEASTFNAARRGGIRINGNSPSGYGYADDFAIKVPAA